MNLDGLLTAAGMIITIGACNSESLPAMLILGSFGASLMFWGVK